MAKAEKVKHPENLASVAGNVLSSMIVIFVIVILTVFPIYYKNFYFDILEAKYRFYYISVVSLAVISLVTALVFAFVDCMEYGGENTKKFFRGLSLKSLVKNRDAVAITLLIFLIFAGIATFQSDYLYESFWGNEGRYSGYFLILLYALTVFMIGKLGRIQKWHLDAFLLAGALVCLFGITDYFRMDLLHWKVRVDSGQKDSFTSTIGNINTYTAYVSLVMGVACGLFVTEKNIFRRIWYLAMSALSFFAIITGQSDNAYLALGALFGLMPLLVFNTRAGIKRYSTLVAMFMTVIKLISDINVKMPEKVIGLSGIFKMLTKQEKLGLIVIALWGLAAVLYISDYIFSQNEANSDRTEDKKDCKKETNKKDNIKKYINKKDTNKKGIVKKESNKKGIVKKEANIKENDKKDIIYKDGKVGIWLRIAWLGLLAVALAVVIWIFYDANFGGNAEKYANYSSYIVFNDNWGTNRGYSWRIAWEAYMKQPLGHKLFGFGPDTFGILTWDYREESLKTLGVFFESAHNEYLQYLVTMGPFGLLSYVAFLIASCAAMIRAWSREPWVLAPLAAVICYGAQAIVNINLPIATPVMWTLLAAGVAISRKKKDKYNVKENDAKG